MAMSIPSVCIAVITCGRPAGLEKLLRALCHLKCPDFPDAELEVVVVENGRKEQAERQVESFRARGLSVSYAHEPQPGISYARNCAMSLAVERADYVALIDDDEYPGPHWLNALLRCTLERNAPLVCGPVLPILPSDAPHWAIAGGFFTRERYPCGTALRYCASNNVLIRSDLLRGANLHFRPEFALTGGSDTMFFLQLCQHHAIQPIWCDQAPVYEDVTRDRVTLKWLKRRARRAGGNMPQFDALLGVPYYRLRWISHGVYHVLGAVLLRLRSYFSRPLDRVRSHLRLSMGVGMIRGALGYFVNEYSERHQR